MLYLLSSFILVFELALESSNSVWICTFLHLPQNEPFFRNNRTQMPKPNASTVVRSAYPFHPEVGPSLGGIMKARVLALYCPVKFIFFNFPLRSIRLIQYFCDTICRYFFTIYIAMYINLFENFRIDIRSALVNRLMSELWRRWQRDIHLSII